MKLTTKAAVIKRLDVPKIALFHLLIVSVAIIIIWPWNKLLALESLYGTAIFFIPNTYFAWQSFRYVGAAHNKSVIHSFYKAQATKFVLTVIMFAGLFIIVKPASVLIVFCSYIVNNVIHVILAALLINKIK